MIQRQLSAIMFTDLAGYTAMMQEDETGAKGIRDRHRRILEDHIRKYQGKILQYYGDGALSVFGSTISAADAAVSIQKASVEDKIALKIGIHSGDVVIDEDGVYGDGVNIASRIESFSVPGSVMISDKVFDDLKNHQQYRPVLMGEFELKNVKRPVEVYALDKDGLIVPTRTDLKGKVKEHIKSIAVLPFVNRSADPENEYFSDGITEEIITALAKIEGLRVISRTSSFAFKGKNVDIRDIGKQLEVQSILDGSVRKYGNKVRITAQLSSTLDGYQLWTSTYDRMLEDIFEVQDEISLKIARQLRERLEPGESTHGTSRQMDLEAYNAFLHGRYMYNKWTPGDANEAIKSFRKALEIEPNYDQAYAGIALAYSLMSFTGYIEPHSGYQLTEQFARKTLELNPENENAYIALSYVDYLSRWDFDAGKRNALKAMEINPKSPDVNTSLSLYYLAKGDLQKSIECVEKAREIDPLSASTTRTLADCYYLKGDYDMAIRLYDWLLEQTPDFSAAVEFKAWAHLMRGEHDVAISLFTSIDGETIHAIKPFVQLGYAHALKGDRNKAEYFLQELKKYADQHPDQSHNFDFATLYAGLGEKDKAFYHLEICLQQKLGPMMLLKLSPIWAPLRPDPRFDRLLQEIGL